MMIMVTLVSMTIIGHVDHGDHGDPGEHGDEDDYDVGDDLAKKRSIFQYCQILKINAQKHFFGGQIPNFSPY